MNAQELINEKSYAVDYMEYIYNQKRFSEYPKLKNHHLTSSDTHGGELQPSLPLNIKGMMQESINQIQNKNKKFAELLVEDLKEQTK
jgi:hypothetical protein